MLEPTVTAEQMWSKFALKYDTAGRTYEAWAFGLDAQTADELADLSEQGIKTATASAHALYELENSPLPHVGGLNIVLDSAGEARIIIETTKVTVCPFAEVTEEQAYKEGEGDRSLEFWRAVHRDVFSRELEPFGLPFSEDMLVVCEEFKVIYK